MTTPSGLLIGKHIRHVTQAAAAWAEGDVARAATELEHAEAELPHEVDRGAAAAAADRVADLRKLVQDVSVPEISHA